MGAVEKRGGRREQRGGGEEEGERGGWDREEGRDAEGER